MTIKSDDTQVNLEQARKFGRVSDDGHVFVIVEGEEYAVGQLPGASEEEALAYFARKFENVEAQVSLLESRVENNSPAADLQKGISSIGAQIGVRNMVGDYASLQERLSALNERIIKLGEAQQQERAENRERALAAREEIVAEAEQIAAQDVEKIHWKNSHARMNELFDAWNKHSVKFIWQNQLRTSCGNGSAPPAPPSTATVGRIFRSLTTVTPASNARRKS